jgi:hypothetical protein
MPGCCVRRCPASFVIPLVDRCGPPMCGGRIGIDARIRRRCHPDLRRGGTRTWTDTGRHRRTQADTTRASTRCVGVVLKKKLRDDRPFFLKSRAAFPGIPRCTFLTKKIFRESREGAVASMHGCCVRRCPASFVLPLVDPCVPPMCGGRTHPCTDPPPMSRRPATRLEREHGRTRADTTPERAHDAWALFTRTNFTTTAPSS